METPGQRVKRLREAAGLSQPQLADRAGLPVGTLRNIEQDHRPDPQLSTAAALAVALGVSLDVIAGITTHRRAPDSPTADSQN